MSDDGESAGSSNSSCSRTPPPKRKKASHASRLNEDEHKKEHLFEVFVKYYSNLVRITRSCVSTFRDQLFSRKMLSEEVHGELITGKESDQTKASSLLYHVKNQLKVNPKKLLEFIDILKEEPLFDDITKDMMSDINDYDKNQAAMEHFPIISSEMSPAFTRYSEYLKYYYCNEPIERDDRLSIAPCSQFISLALIEKSKKIKRDDLFSKHTLHGGVDEILASKTPLKMDALLDLERESHFVLVEGPPGIGKSTLCWELCRKWDALKSLHDYKIVLQLKLRERRVQNATSLNELFYHRDRELCQNVVDEVYRCEGDGVLLILDGFDEMTFSCLNDKRNLIMELIRGICLPRATRLVTSRPSALYHKEECFPQKYRHVEILGFTDKYKVDFAEIAFKSEPDVLSHFKSFVLSNPIIKSLMYIPLNCAIVAQLYRDIRRSALPLPKTMTQLYATLIPVLIRRCMIEKGEWDKQSRVPSSLNEFPKEVFTRLKRVGKLAYEGLFKKNVQLIFTDSDIGNRFQHLGLLNETKEMYVSKGARTSYSFLHLSIQEFLAAWHVSCHPNIKKRAIDKVYHGDHFNVTPHLRVFGQFLAGSIGCSDFPVQSILSNHVQLIKKKTFLLRCLYEAQDPSILNSIRSNSPLCRGSLRNPLDAYIFGYTFVHAPIIWDLRIASSLPMLVSSLADHANSGNKILGTIAELILSWQESHEIDCLPKHVRDTVLKIRVDSFNSKISVSPLSVGIPSLRNLLSVTLDVEERCQDDHLMYRALQALSNLILLFIPYLLKEFGNWQVLLLSAVLLKT